MFVETWHSIKTSKKAWVLHYVVSISCRVIAFCKDLYRVYGFSSETHLMLGILEALSLYKMPTWSVPRHLKGDQYIYRSRVFAGASPTLSQASPTTSCKKREDVKLP